MHVATSTALIVTALVASVYLLTHFTDRLFAVLALAASGVEALITFKIVSISITKLRIDLALAVLLFVGGAVCLHRASAKAGVVASAVVALIGLQQVLSALHVLR
jgi:hypothetical protein